MKSELQLRRKVRRSYIVSTISMALVLFVLGCLGSVVYGAWHTSKQVQESVAIMVELKDKLSVADRDTIALRIAKSDLVSRVCYTTKEQKIEDEEFRKLISVDIEKILNNNPLPNSLDIYLCAGVEKTAVEDLIEQCRNMKGVTYVSYPEALLQNVQSSLGILLGIVFIFCAAMAVISLILLSNTIRLSIFTQREFITTLKIVGASRWYILAPFLKKSVGQGFIAAIIAVVLFGCSAYAIMVGVVGGNILEYLTPIAIISGAMVVCGIVIATLFTAIVVWKIVNTQSNKIYLF